MPTVRPIIAVGVDVGGPRKGFHAVALSQGKYLCKTSGRSALQIEQWCRELGARVVGIDAPCRWSATGRARPAERKLMTAGVWCFSTPTRAAAQSHPRNHFAWMLAGAELYGLLERNYLLYDGLSMRPEGLVCFETYPQAIACAIAGQIILAKRKCSVRRSLLDKVGLDTSALSNIDTVDAALCAWTAQEFVKGATVAHGEPETGYIVVPR